MYQNKTRPYTELDRGPEKEADDVRVAECWVCIEKEDMDQTNKVSSPTSCLSPLVLSCYKTKYALSRARVDV